MIDQKLSLPLRVVSELRVPKAKKSKSKAESLDKWGKEEGIPQHKRQKIINYMEKVLKEN